MGRSRTSPSRRTEETFTVDELLFETVTFTSANLAG